VAILSTGNELEGLDEPVDPNKITRRPTAMRDGADAGARHRAGAARIARDDPDELALYLRRGLEYDVLLVSGGTSVGVP